MYGNVLPYTSTVLDVVLATVSGKLWEPLQAETIVGGDCRVAAVILDDVRAPARREAGVSWGEHARH